MYVGPATRCTEEQLLLAWDGDQDWLDRSTYLEVVSSPRDNVVQLVDLSRVALRAFIGSTPSIVASVV